MSTTSPPSNAVVLSVPLRAEFASAIRTLVTAVAADLDFTVDELDDLRLGVSELFTILVEPDPSDTDGDHRCEVWIDVQDGEMSVVMSRSAGGDVELDGLAAAILHSVVDSHELVDRGVVMRKRAAEAVG